MNFTGQDMKGPSRPAPTVPGVCIDRYSPVTNWNDDPFGSDVFEPTPSFVQKKQPPPRPPPPKVQTKQPDVPVKPSHFIRRPTVLSSLLSRKNKTAAVGNQNIIFNSQSSSGDFTTDLVTTKMFPKCEPRNVHTGALIDLSSPPSSPTFTTRSSSDGLSVDSFGSDATTSTSHHNMLNGGNASQAESGFEDDFDLFLHSRKAIAKDDTLDDFAFIDPFSPQSVSKPPIMKKPDLSKDLLELSCNGNSQISAPILKGPTIIRAKPARPKPPDNSAILKNTFGNNFAVTAMNVNTTMPIQKVCHGFSDSFLQESKPNWDEESSPERESSPPMPSIPPPPPPAADASLDLTWPAAQDSSYRATGAPMQYPDEPHALALFDYFTDHPDDLCFSTNSKITLIRRVDDEWLYGRLRNGPEGLFPANYVEVMVPLPGEPRAQRPPQPPPRIATALYDFEPVQAGDLRFCTGDTISVLYKINDEWLQGECKGATERVVIQADPREGDFLRSIMPMISLSPCIRISKDLAAGQASPRQVYAVADSTN